MKNTITKKPYALLIIAILFIAKAQAQIVYTDVVPDTVLYCNMNPSCSENFNLDLNNDGTNDYLLSYNRINYMSCGMIPPRWDNKITVSNSNPNAYFGWDLMYPLELNYGATIDNNLNWTSGTGTLRRFYRPSCTPVTGTFSGNWFNIGDHYLPVKLVIGGNNYFGWIRIQVIGSGVFGGFLSATVKDYAFNLIPNQQMIAGQTGLAATINGNFSICPGDSTTLSVVGGNSFQWSTGATTSSITVSPLSTSTYSVTVTDTVSGNSTILSQQVSIVIINTSVLVSACNILFSEELLLNSIQWFDCNTLQPIPGAINSSFIPSSPGLYFAIINKNSCIDTTGCYYASGISFSVTGNTTICVGDSVTLMVSNGDSILWSTGDTTSSITVSPLSTTTYTVSVTDTTNACSKNYSQQIIVININTSVTQQNCNTLILSPNPPSTLQWFDCSNWQPVAGATTNSFSPVSSGTYSAVISKLGCIDTTACYYAAPINFSVTGNTTLCLGESTTLSVTNGNLFLWSTGETTSAITVSPLSTTTYTVNVTDTFGTCSFSQQITVNSVNTSVTQPDCNTLLSQESLPTSIQWFDCNALQQIPGANSSSFDPSNPGLYSAIISKNGCTDTTACYYAAAISFSGTGNTIICLGESTTLSVTNGNTFLWNTGDTTSTITVSPLITSLYIVNVTDTVGTCTMNFIQQITVTSINNSLTQSGDTLFANAGFPATYQWMNCATMQIVPGATNAIFLAASGGSYAAIITKDGCTDTTACATVIGLGINEQQNLFGISISPNPFSNSTTISFSLSQPENIFIRIFDTQGRLVKTLANSKFIAGTHSVDWNVKDEKGNADDAGIYFLKVEGENFSQTKKLSVVK